MFGYGNQEVGMCQPNYEEQAKNAKIESDKIDSALKALEACPYLDIDYKSVDCVVGGLYRAKIRAEQRFKEATEKLEKK